MKRISILIVLILSTLALAEVRTFYWIHPRCGMMRTMTSNPAHIAIMEAYMADCEEEEPVDTKKKLTKEKKDTLTAEELLLVKPLKIKRVKWTDPNTGKVYGNDKEYTVLKRFPNFKADPNEI